MAIKFAGQCKACANGKPTKSWQEIGEKVHIEGGKNGDTEHTFFQCGQCGSLWLQVDDIGGIGGYGTYFHRLTKGFF